MLFGKKDKDVRLSNSQYKGLVGSMNKKERKEFERKQREFRNERENDRIEAWLDLEDDLDDMGF